MPTGRSALWSQIGYGEETTVGTYTAPTRFLEFNNEALALSIARVESATLRSTNRVLRTDRWAAGRRGVSGQITHELQSNGYGLLLKYLHGAAPAIATPMGATNTRTQTFTIGDPFGIGLSVQVGRPDVATGTVRPFSYVGCKVSDWTISNSVDQMLMMQMNIDGWNEDTSQTLGAASYPSSAQTLNWTGGLLNIAGAEVDVRDVSITMSAGLKTDRYLISSKTTKKEQIASAMISLSGTITAEFVDLVAYNRFVNGTTAQVDVTWTAATAIEGSFFPSLKITLPNCRFDGATPAVPGPGDVIIQRLPFKVVWDGSAQPITTVYQTSDTAV